MKPRVCFLTPAEAQNAADALGAAWEASGDMSLLLAIRALQDGDVIYIRSPEPIPMRSVKDRPYIGTLADYRAKVAAEEKAA